MTRVAAMFVGCKVSQADGEEALAELSRSGHEAMPAAGEAELVVVHTCCVTAEAERKSRRLVRRAAAGGRRVIAAGCAAALRPEQFEGRGVIVEARPDWAELGKGLAASHVGSGAPVGPPPEGRGGRNEAPAATAGVRTRQVLKVQDGCAGACAYCVVRLVRGAPRSLPLADVLAAARAGIAGGCGEVVLSGIDLGAWRDGEARLPELLAAVAELDGLRRVRLSSLEPRHVTPALLELLSHPRVARHLHVPLQSGDDGVLTAMRRPYTYAGYLEAVAGVGDVPGGAMLGTDVIVGFPGEDEAAFARTLAALEEGRFGRVHVFAFSARPGTAAAELPPLPAAVIRDRMGRALAAAEAAARHARRSLLGREIEVLVEERRDGLWRGYSSEYMRCRLRGEARRGELVRAVAEEIVGDEVLGSIKPVER